MFESKSGLKIVIAAIAIIITVAAIIGIFFLDEIFDNTSSDSGSATEHYKDLNTAYIDGKAYLPKDLTSILIIGIDRDGKFESSDSYNNKTQADFLALLVFDNKNKEYSIIHINRDTMTNITALGVTGQYVGDRYEQIALANTYGNGLEQSAKNTVSAVSRLFYGTKIDYYISMTMDALVAISDSEYIEDIELYNDEDLTAIDPSFIKDTTLTLNGERAMKYVRARMSTPDGTNLSRMKRQKNYVNALVSKMSKESPSTDYITKTYNAIKDYILTDSSVSALSDALTMMSEYEYKGIISPEGHTELGEYVEFYADYSSLVNIAKEKLYDPKE